jgi:hypothetical protein
MQHCLQLWSSIRSGVHLRAVQAPWHHTVNNHSLSPSGRRANRACQPGTRTVSLVIRLPMLYERTHEFPWYFCDFIRFSNRHRSSRLILRLAPQHSHATSCVPHARLALPHVGSASAPCRTTGTAIPWNPRGLATCPVCFRGTSGSAFRLVPVPPRTCRSRLSH